MFRCFSRHVNISKWKCVFKEFNGYTFEPGRFIFWNILREVRDSIEVSKAALDRSDWLMRTINFNFTTTTGWKISTKSVTNYPIKDFQSLLGQWSELKPSLLIKILIAVAGRDYLLDFFPPLHSAHSEMLSAEVFVEVEKSSGVSIIKSYNRFHTSSCEHRSHLFCRSSDPGSGNSIFFFFYRLMYENY